MSPKFRKFVCVVVFLSIVGHAAHEASTTYTISSLWLDGSRPSCRYIAEQHHQQLDTSDHQAEATEEVGDVGTGGAKPLTEFGPNSDVDLTAKQQLAVCFLQTYGYGGVANTGWNEGLPRNGTVLQRPDIFPRTSSSPSAASGSASDDHQYFSPGSRR